MKEIIMQYKDINDKSKVDHNNNVKRKTSEFGSIGGVLAVFFGLSIVLVPAGYAAYWIYDKVFGFDDHTRNDYIKLDPTEQAKNLCESQYVKETRGQVQHGLPTAGLINGEYVVMIGGVVSGMDWSATCRVRNGAITSFDFDH